MLGMGKEEVYLGGRKMVDTMFELFKNFAEVDRTTQSEKLNHFFVIIFIFDCSLSFSVHECCESTPVTAVWAQTRP